MKIIPKYNRDMLIKYDKLLPRYTSYPTALKFHDKFTTKHWHEALRETALSESKLSLYFHIPFCTSPCFYCACNRIITRDSSRSIPYLDAIFNEMDLVSQNLLPSKKNVSQIHFGGGTPTFLKKKQLAQLWEKINNTFTLEADGEYSIEIDPRASDVDLIKNLVNWGFNRMSFGVQDLEESVQKAVNRIQSAKETFSQIEAARAAGVSSINIDLIYGLPKQNVKTFSSTIDRIISVRPERVAVYSYAHMPSMFKAQTQINKYYLPSLSEKLSLLEVAIEKFSEAGYEYIGLDHFTLPDDPLAIARSTGTLQRNFQGYSTNKDCNMLGFGVTSIGKIGNAYYQNNKLESQYIEQINKGKLPIQKGYLLTEDDKIRSNTILSLMCQGKLDFAQFQSCTGYLFFDYYRSCITELKDLENDGLLKLDEYQLQITSIGQLLLRNIANIFDAYRRPQF